MSFFDDFSKKISDAGQSTIQKTKTIAEIAKFNSMISDEEKRINNLYEQIGKQYVSMFGQEPEESFKELIESIKGSEDKISEYRKNISDLKGMAKCPKCGAEVENGTLFCRFCGAEMTNEEEVFTPETAHCPECGVEVPAGSRFCTSCGKALGDTEDGGTV